MGKNFRNSNSAKTFDVVGKASAEKSQIMMIHMIDNENLIDNPKNGEDVSYTLDLEDSMGQIGFSDPMEITSWGMPTGKYMILSGHRRRKAGVNFGFTVFPCIIRTFKDGNDIQNYTLLSNNQRDSAKDPFLFTKRYKLHEQYLIENDFKGSKREEIAKRLGLSVQQADRYNMFNKIILPVWDLVRSELIGMSSVQGMAKYEMDEQMEILLIMQEVMELGKLLTRDTMKLIIDGYHVGNKTWLQITDSFSYNVVEIGANIVDIDVKMNGESTQSQDIGVNSHESITSVENINDITVDARDKQKTCNSTRDIVKAFGKLDTRLRELQGNLHCESKEQAEEICIVMKNTCMVIIDEMNAFTNENEMLEDFNAIISDLKVKLDNY